MPEALSVADGAGDYGAMSDVGPNLILPLPSLDATRALATVLAAHLVEGDVLALWGDLGAGKTAFARFLIRSLGDPDQEVPSPTFTLVQTYDAEPAMIWHFDLYRLSHPQDIVELGWDEARLGIILVEWPDRLGALLPRDRLDMVLEMEPTEAESAQRIARLRPHGLWTGRMAALAGEIRARQIGE